MHLVAGEYFFHWLGHAVHIWFILYASSNLNIWCAQTVLCIQCCVKFNKFVLIKIVINFSNIGDYEKEQADKWSFIWWWTIRIFVGMLHRILVLSSDSDSVIVRKKIKFQELIIPKFLDLVRLDLLILIL